MHVLTKLCVFRVYFLFSRLFPSDRDCSTKSSVKKIEKTALGIIDFYRVQRLQGQKAYKGVEKANEKTNTVFS